MKQILRPHEIVQDPWPHVIIDDFLDQDHLQSLLSLEYKEDVDIKKPAVSVFKVINKEYKAAFPKKWKHMGNRNVEKNASGIYISRPLILGIVNRYQPLLFDIMNKLNPEKAHLYDYSELQIASTHKDTVYRMHTDDPDKLLTLVVYLKPESNTGTVMSNSKKGPDTKTVEWKQNRAFIFSSKDDVTWHRWQGDNISTRHVLIYILRCDKSKIKGQFFDEN